MDEGSPGHDECFEGNLVNLSTRLVLNAGIPASDKWTGCNSSQPPQVSFAELVYGLNPVPFKTSTYPKVSPEAKDETLAPHHQRSAKPVPETAG